MRLSSSIAGYLLLVASLLSLQACSSVAAISKTPRNTGVGQASYYAHKFHGRPTASGEIYDEDKLTAAHPRLPFGTRVRVTNLANKKSVVCRINDRGPLGGKRIIDLSFKAAQELDFVREGIVRVRVEIIKES